MGSKSNGGTVDEEITQSFKEEMMLVLSYWFPDTDPSESVTCDLGEVILIFLSLGFSICKMKIMAPSLKILCIDWDKT